VSISILCNADILEMIYKIQTPYMKIFGCFVATILLLILVNAIVWGISVLGTWLSLMFFTVVPLGIYDILLVVWATFREALYLDDKGIKWLAAIPFERKQVTQIVFDWSEIYGIIVYLHKGTREIAEIEISGPSRMRKIYGYGSKKRMTIKSSADTLGQIYSKLRQYVPNERIEEKYR
jgi:hypothetical protein